MTLSFLPLSFPPSQISLYLPVAMAMCGVSSATYTNNPTLTASLTADRLSLAPVLTFWVGVSHDERPWVRTAD